MMKKMFWLLLAAVSCEALGEGGDGSGILRVSFADGQEELTRTSAEIPDADDFTITVTDSKGKSVYSGLYGACPEELEVPAGSYVVSALSAEFEKPVFSAPQYGDAQCVLVPDGAAADVNLECSQQNSGVRLKVDSDFLTAYPDGVLFLKSPQGKLMYGYSEKRIAYFLPGQVSLMLSRGSVDQVLMTRTLQAGEILDLKIDVATSSPSQTDGPSARIKVAVDTSRVWLSDVYEIGGASDKGSAPSSALTVSQAIASVGTQGVWVCGYIVGGDLTSSSASFSAPFQSRTNILLGPKSSTSVKSSCLSVQLPAGEFRDALNLVDDSSILGKKVYIKGDIVEAYYGIPGIKNVSDYKL